MPLILKYIYGGITVLIEQDDFERLRRYQGQRMLLLPNHPTGEEPAVMFQISKWLDEVFNFVAARELFDCERGFRGWMMRRIGTYSVIRGTTDRESFLMSKQILMEGKNRLVIFIEGEISRENDTLIPFEPGVIQLAYWAQEALVKEAGKPKTRKHRMRAWRPDEHAPAPEDAAYPPIYLVPVAIKYFYRPGVEPVIEQALRNLEAAVGLTPEAGMDSYQRVQAIGKKVMDVQEAMHQIVSMPGTTLNERVEAIKNRMLKRMELFLDLRPDPEANTLARLREIRNTIDRLVHSYEDPADLTLYEQRMVKHFQASLTEFQEDLNRVVSFLTYDEAYLRDNPTPERLIEMLRRLEREVFGSARLTHPRVAVVKVGEVISLKDNFAEYEADKKNYPKQLAERLEADMMRMITGMRRPAM